MTNIALKPEKSKVKGGSSLPFADYILAIKKADSAKYNALIADIKNAACIKWDCTISRYEQGYRPSELRCRVIAEVIAKHSGDASWTAERLFPIELYKK